MKIGEQIKVARAVAGLTQDQLAEKANVHRTYVSQLERDKKSPTLDVLVRIAEALGSKASSLVSEAEAATSKKK